MVSFRCCTVQSSFVFNARLLFSKDTIGPTPPAVLLLSDGGHYENLAILPLLQRKLKRIVVVDGGYKDEEEAYGDSILDALMLARSELNCSFYGENDEDVIADLMQMFVKPGRKEKPRYYKYATPSKNFLHFMINRIVVFLPNKISLKDLFDRWFDLTV